MKKGEGAFFHSLESVRALTKNRTKISLREIFFLLSGKGHAALLVLLSLPFCLPIQIPGFSTPFGIALAFIGLRIAFGKRPWLPRWILDKKLSAALVCKLVDKTEWLIRKLSKVLKPRLNILATGKLFHRTNGLLVCTLALLMSLPLPIPLTNMLSAFPILFIGLGLLEDDGLCIAIAYLLALICFASFTGLFLFGEKLWHNQFFKRS